MRSLLALLALAAWAPVARPCQTPNWIDQLGTPATDVVRAAAPDGLGGVLIAGESAGALAGPSAGASDAWLARLNSGGAILWIRSLGTAADDSAWAIASDTTGGAFVAGTTSGNLFGAGHGASDAWLARYDASGALQWGVQLGTAGDERAQALLVDGSGGFLASGSTGGALGGSNLGGQDAWVGRFTASGGTQWLRQWGSSGLDNATCLAADGAGGFFVGGATDGALAAAAAGNFDVWLARCDPFGNPAWTIQFGTPELDGLFSLVPDAHGGAFLSMTTAGALAGPSLGHFDACAARFDAGGAQVWMHQFGSAGEDSALAAVSDGTGGCFFTGHTSGALAGPLQGQLDAWARRFDAAGNALEGIQFGSAGSELTFAAALTPAGGLYLAGQTHGSLDGPNQGNSDAWVALALEPCAAPLAYGSASSTSIPGCFATLSALGSASASDPTAFTLRCTPTPGPNVGVCLFSVHGQANIPYGTQGGHIWIAPPIQRTPPRKGSGTLGACSGTLDFTLLDLAASSNVIAPGALVHAQVWMRDPGSADGFLLSDALQFQVCP